MKWQGELPLSWARLVKWQGIVRSMNVDEWFARGETVMSRDMLLDPNLDHVEKMRQNLTLSSAQLKKIIWDQLPRGVADKCMLVVKQTNMGIKPPVVTFYDEDANEVARCELTLDRDNRFTIVPDKTLAQLCVTIL